MCLVAAVNAQDDSSDTPLLAADVFDFFGFPKVKWLQLTGEMGKFISFWAFDVKFSQYFTYQNH